MKTANQKLLQDSLLVEGKLYRVVVAYESMRDIRWMFAYAHFRITQQINRAVRRPVFRDPDQLLRFNGSFATAFLAAVAGQASRPWKTAFANCAVAEASYDQVRGPRPDLPRAQAQDPTALALCAAAMAQAHINTDIVNALRTVGCINKEDYANVLIFVERAAREAIYKANGSIQGGIVNLLRELLVPLEKVWRNAVYEDVCGVPVPDPEQNFVENIDKMSYIHPSR